MELKDRVDAARVSISLLATTLRKGVLSDVFTVLYHYPMLTSMKVSHCNDIADMRLKHLEHPAPLR